MTWRYQPTYEVHGEERVYGLTEVYLDKKGKLTAWTSTHFMTPTGNDPADLRGTLKLMLREVDTWEAVEYKALRVGIEFVRKEQSTQ